MMSRVRSLYALFALSGFCGLIYESIWSHYLQLFLGHAAYAQTAVLIVFIGGLALGSWVAGLFAKRIARPLIAYAAAEFLVGVSALAFHPLFVRATAWAYQTLLPAACSAEGACPAQWAFAAAMILPQSILLGTTFPLMSGGLLRLDANAAGGKLGMLYFLNSIGAVVGVLSSGYLLIPAIGLPGALMTAGVLNVLLSIAVYAVDKNSEPAREVHVAPVAPEAGQTQRAFTTALLAIALLTGLSSFIYEIAWIRSLSLVLGSSTHSFELMLAAFILGLALGSLWIAKRIERLASPIRYLARVQIAMGVLAVLTLPTYSATFDVMSWMLHALQRSDAGWTVFNLGSSLLSVAVMLPTTLMAGMTLPLITYTLLRSPMGERSIGHVYGVNTLGGILGVIVAVHLALPLLGLKGALILGGTIDVALGIFLLWRLVPAAPGRARAYWSGTGVAAIAVVFLAFHLNPLKLASGVFTFGHAALTNDYRILSHADGKTATVDVFENKRLALLAIATNGKVDGAIGIGPQAAPDEYTMFLLAGLALAHRPDARTAAVIGYGTGVSTTTLLASPRIERVDTIEIEPAMIQGARAFRPLTDPAYTDPRSHLIIDDAKSYFARSRRHYDLILSEPSNPWVSGVSNLFSREFYARARGQLSAHGLLVQWLHTYSFNEALLASVLRAVRESFPNFIVYAPNDGDLILVGSPSGPVPPLSSEAFHLGRLPEYLKRIDVRRVEDMGLRRVADQKTLMQLFALVDGPPNSDYFPYVDTHAGKARYTAEEVHSVLQLATAPWPIVEMAATEATPPHYPITPAGRPSGEQQEEALRAGAIHAYLTGRSRAEDVRATLGPLFRPVDIFRLGWIECRDGLSPDEWWDAIATTANLVTVYLPPAASDEVWSRVRGSSCFAKLPEPVRNWFALFEAIGRRDPKAMADLGERLLAGTHSPEQAKYFYGAAMTGLLASGRRDDARQLYVRYHHQLSDGDRMLAWYRWMAGATFSAQ